MMPRALQVREAKSPAENSEEVGKSEEVNHLQAMQMIDKSDDEEKVKKYLKICKKNKQKKTRHHRWKSCLW